MKRRLNTEARIQHPINLTPSQKISRLLPGKLHLKYRSISLRRHETSAEATATQRLMQILTPSQKNTEGSPEEGTWFFTDAVTENWPLITW